MEIEEIVLAQEGIINTTQGAVCPCCAGTDWRGLAALDHLLTAGIVPAESHGTLDPSEDRVAELFQVGLRRQPLVGIFCTGCGFVRFHVPLPDGI